MSVRCVLWRRKFLTRIEGELPPAVAARLDEHLAGCGECRELFARVRSGHAAGRLFGRLRPAPPTRLPEFEEIWTDGGAARGGRPPALALGLRVVAAGTVAGLAFLVLFHGIRASGPARGGFKPLAIREFATNTRNRIVTEGFVHNVYFDAEEKTLHVKLVEGPRQTEPFVICEIRDPGRVAVPREGNRVRVYGTARYDAQPGRGWHEVNPVAEIAVLKR